MVMITRAGGSSFGTWPDGSGLSYTDIHDLIEVGITSVVKETIPKMSQSIKDEMIALFDERYAAFANTTVVASIFCYCCCCTVRR